MISWRAGFRIRQYVKGSMWVVPLLGAIAGGLLAQLSLTIDAHVDVSQSWQYSQGTASRREGVDS